MESKKPVKVIRFVLVCLALACILFIYDFYTKTKIVKYPHGEYVFKKYYDAEHTLRALYTSDDSSAEILSWYDGKFSKYVVTENLQHDKCAVKSWNIPARQTKLVVCDHATVRTILTEVSFE